MATTRTTALRIRDHSGALEVVETELAAPGADEMLVELSYGGVNPVDRYIAGGLVGRDGPLPRTLGGEASGSCDGRPVLVAGGGLGTTRDGVWARHAVVPRETVLALPPGVDPQQAAAAGIAGLTAWGTVVDLARVTAADRVLVLGAAGGVGLAIVSLAASLGAQVWGQVRSAGKASAVRAAGAAVVLVADADGLAEAAAGLRPTVVLDPLSGPFVPVALGLLQTRGRYVVFGTSAGADVHVNWQGLYRANLQVLGYGGLVVTAEERRRGLQQVLRALADGRMSIPVGRTVPLADGADVFADPPDGAGPGKTLLDLT